MKKIFYLFLLGILFLIPGKVNASRVSIYSQGVYSGGSDITIFGERFWQFSQVTTSQWRFEIGYEVTSPKYFSVSGYLYIDNTTDSEGVMFPNLALTTLSNACKVEYSNFVTSGDDGLNDIRQKNSLYYFECNHVNYNVNHLLRFELLGQYPTFLGKVYLYDWLNFSYDDDGSTQSIIDNQNKNQQQTNQRLDETNKQLDETNNFLKDDTAPESDISSLGNVQGLLPPGPVDSLLNIPFYFLSIVTSSFGGVCKPLTGNFVFDTELSIPCFSEIIYNDIPSSIMVFINLIPTTFLLIVYFKHLYKKVSRAVSLETTGDDEWGVL